MDNQEAKKEQQQSRADAADSLQQVVPGTAPTNETKRPQNAEASKPAHKKDEAQDDAQIPQKAPFWVRAWEWAKRDAKLTDWLIAILTGVIAGTSYLQWREIHSGSSDTHTLAVATDQQMRLTREQVHIGQRAYLVFHDAKLKAPLKVGRPAEVQITLLNSGQTPAIEVSHWTFLEIVSPCPPSISLPFQRSSYIGAGRDMKITAVSIEALNASQVSQIKTEEITLTGNVLSVSQRPRLCFFGAVRYKDVFGGSGETHFCAAYEERAKGLAACNVGNWMQEPVAEKK